MHQNILIMEKSKIISVLVVNNCSASDNSIDKYCHIKSGLTLTHDHLGLSDELLLWLQGLLTPTTQIPICVARVSLLVLLLLPDVVLEGACAFVIIIIVGADNKGKPIPIAKNKNINMLLRLSTSDWVM